MQSSSVAIPAVWQWCIYSPEELRMALEEYNAFSLDEFHFGNGGDPDPTKKDRAWRIYAQNKLIDEGMRDIKLEHHRQWDVLHGYYRMGLEGERRGWHEVAVKILKWELVPCQPRLRCRVQGDDRTADTRNYLSSCPGRQCEDAHQTFEEVVDEALHLLFAAIEVRCGRK